MSGHTPELAGDPVFGNLLRLAARLTAARVAFLQVDEGASEFLSHYGAGENTPGAEYDEQLAGVICRHVLSQRVPLVVNDVATHLASDPGSAISRLGVAAYIGFPVLVQGEVVGALCAVQSEPRAWSRADIDAIQDLAVLAASRIELDTTRTALVSRDEALRDLLEHATDMIVRISTGGSVLYANKAVRGALGYDLGQLTGKRVSDLVAPEHRESYASAVDRVVREGYLPDFSAGFMTSVGDCIVVRGSANCEYDGGNPVSIRLTFRDVTVKHRLQEELALIEDVASLISEGEDLASGFTDCLEKICEYGNWDRGEVWLRDRGRGAQEFLTSWTRPGIAADMLPAAANAGQQEGEALFELATRGDPHLANGVAGSSRRLTETGTGTLAAVPLMSGEEYAGLLAFYSVRERPAREQRLAVLSAVTTQIGPLLRRRITEEALRASDARYRHLIETAQEGVWTFDTAGNTTYTNVRMTELLGYAVDEIMGRPVLDFLHPDGRPVALAHFDTSAGVKKESHECRFLRKDGSECWALVSTSPTVDRAGRHEGTLALVTDITRRKAAETQLRMREKQLAEAQEVARTGSWDWDLASGKLTGSDGLYRVLGLPPDSPLTYELLLEHVAESDAERVRKAMLASIEHRLPLSIEYSIVNGDGQPRTIFSRGDFYYDESGLSARMAGIAQDITERKNAENDLRRTAQMVELANEAVVIRGLDGVISFWNQGAERIYGWSREEALGQRIHDLLGSRGLEGEGALIGQVVRDGRWAGELSHAHKDGRKLRIDSRWTLLKTGEEPVSVLEINSDVTERHRVQQLFGAVLAAAINYSIIGTDSNGTIHTFNAGAEQMLGYTASEMIGKRIPDIIHDEAEILARGNELGVEPGFDVLVANVRDGAGETRDWTYIRKDGSRLPVSLTVTEMRDASGENTGHIGIAVDITERRAVEQATLALKEAAEQTAKAKSEFLANMSHEIRTPMNGITAMTELLLDTDLAQEQREYLELVQVSAHSLLRIIDDILDFSRIDAGKLRFELHPFELRQSLRETLRTLELRARDKGIRLHYEVNDQVPDILVGDLGRLRQVIVNLVENAIKFTSFGEVRVEVDAEDRTDRDVVVRIQVTDTGMGIPADRQQMILEPFTQADSSTTRRYGGSGLGLTISRDLVEMMGGKLWLESVEGEGSCFGFTVKLELGTMPLRATARPAPRKRQKPGATVPPLSILVAEDNPVNRRLAVAILEKEGHTVALVGTGLEAVRLSESGAFDAILMDVQMPELGGLEATRIIRQREAGTGHHVPIIGVTAHAMAGDAERCVESGMDAYCAKPIRIQELHETLNRLVKAERQRVVSRPRVKTEQPPPHDESKGRLVQSLGGDEDLFLELAEIFLADSPAVLRELDDALATTDSAALVRHSHKLRGSAAIFGAANLTSAALRLEQVARAGNYPAAGAELEVLKHAYNEFSELLVTTVGSPGSS